MGTSWAHQKLKKKKLSFQNVFFYVYPTTMNHFLTGLWHVTKSGFYTMTGNNQLSGWTEKKLKSNSQHQTCTKKRSQSLFGGLLPVWSTTASWIPVKPLYLRSMLSKLMRCTKNCNACRQHFFSRKDPRLLHNNAWLHIARAMLQKLNELGYRVLPHPPYSPALCQPDYHFFKPSWQLFAGKILPQPAGGRKRFPRVCQTPKHRFCTLQEQTNLFLIGKNVLIVMVRILFIKIRLSLVIMIWCEEPSHWKRPWFWERLRTGEWDNRSWGGWMASPTQWTWVWANSRRSWRTEKAAMLQSVVLQRDGHDWATEWQYNDLNFMLWSHKYICNNLIHSIIDYVKINYVAHYRNSEKPSSWKSHLNWILEDKTNWSGEWWRGRVLWVSASYRSRSDTQKKGQFV